MTFQDMWNEHYSNLASNYDNIYASVSPTNLTSSTNAYNFSGESGARMIIEKLRISIEDKVVDLGAGTCKMAGLVALLANLESPIICVDPVDKMLQIAARTGEKNIKPIVATAEEFAKMELKYDKIFIKVAIHHFDRSRLKETFLGIRRQLRENGGILIEFLGDDRKEGSPFFEKGINAQNQLQKGLKDILSNILEDLGFVVEVFDFCYQLMVQKASAIKFISNRASSVLSMMSDVDIKAGILEVERKYANVDIIQWDTKRFVIIAWKNGCTTA